MLDVLLLLSFLTSIIDCDPPVFVADVPCVMVKSLLLQKSSEGTKDNGNSKSRYTAHDFDFLKKHLSTTFNTQVQFSCDNTGKGKISFPFKNDDELAKLITIFDKLK